MGVSQNTESVRVHERLISSRQAAADTIALLVDALDEFHDFVSVHLDPHPGPIEDYLSWPADRIADLRKVLAKPAHIDGSER